MLAIIFVFDLEIINSMNDFKFPHILVYPTKNTCNRDYVIFILFILLSGRNVTNEMEDFIYP